MKKKASDIRSNAEISIESYLSHCSTYHYNCLINVEFCINSLINEEHIKRRQEIYQYITILGKANI